MSKHSKSTSGLITSGGLSTASTTPKGIEPELIQQPKPFDFDYYQVRELPSPDGKWLATVQNSNVRLRSTDDGSIVWLTDDGTKLQPWGDWPWGQQVYWSPDSRRLLVKKRDQRKMQHFPLVHSLQAEETVDWFSILEWPPGAAQRRFNFMRSTSNLSRIRCSTLEILQNLPLT